MNRLYVNGCSWTDGTVLEDEGVLKRFNLTGKGKDYSYPKIVADELKVSLVDESRYGGSLNRITRMLWNYINNNHNSLSKTGFIIEIPTGFRDEVYSTRYDRYFNLTSGNLDNDHDNTEKNEDWINIRKDVRSMYFKFHHFDEFWKKEYINFMSAIMYLKQYTDNIFLLHYGTKKIQTNLFPGVINERNQIKLYHPTFKNFTDYVDIDEMCKSEKISIGDEMGCVDSHPGISGHKIISEIILTHINKITTH